MLSNRINIQLDGISKGVFMLESKEIYVGKQRNMTKCIGIIFAIYY